MNEFSELIEKIKANPNLYLGRRSLIALKAFLIGYSHARQELGIELTEAENEFEEFKKWVQGLGNLKSDKSWDKIILLYSSDDVKALEKFFRLYKNFCLMKSKESNSQI
jgi:ABC-type glycerol-3-phosphate transport system substrate-binding protein